MAHYIAHPIWIEDAIIDLLRINVAVCIPIFILILKLVVLRISGDLDELFRSLIAIPLELMLISIGIVFAGLARTIPFESRYRVDTTKDLAGTVAVIILSGVLTLLNRGNRKILVYLQKYSTAIEKMKVVSQPVLQFRHATSQSPEWRTSWAVAYFMFAVIIWVTEMAIAIFLLWQVFLRIG